MRSFGLPNNVSSTMTVLLEPKNILNARDPQWGRAPSTTAKGPFGGAGIFNVLGVLDRLPALSVSGGAGLAKTEFCSSIFNAVSSYTSQHHFTAASGVPRPTLTIRMKPPDKPEGAWVDCLPLPAPAQALVANMPAWGPGFPPVVSVVGPRTTPLGTRTAGMDSWCGPALDAMSTSVNAVFASIKHSRLDNYAIGPRGGFPTVTISAPAGQMAYCVRAGVFSGGTIESVWPRAASQVAAAPAVTYAQTSYVTVTATPTPKPGTYSQMGYVPFTATPTPKPVAQPTSQAPIQPKASGATAGPAKSLSVQTIPTDQIPCRPFPDQLTTDWSKVPILAKSTKLEVACW
jgi:hypothetical protein